MPGTAFTTTHDATSTHPTSAGRARRALLTGVAAVGLLAGSAGVLVPATAAPATISSATARVHPGVACPGEDPVTAPTFVPISCGDGSAFAIHVRWTYLSTTTGRAKGIVLLDDCVPDCAAGTFHAFAARLTFGRVRQSGGTPYSATPHFTRLRVVFSSRHPAGRPTMAVTY